MVCPHFCKQCFSPDLNMPSKDLNVKDKTVKLLEEIMRKYC